MCGRARRITHIVQAIEKGDEIDVEVPEVRFAFLVTGPHDFVVHIVARDMQHLKDLVLDNFTNRPAVTRVETSIIYEARVRHELPQLGKLSA